MASAMVVIGALGCLAGCSSDSDGATASTIPDRGFTPASDPSALVGEGNEIADGVHVQPDSALVGVAFPTIDPYEDAAAPAGWQAVIAVLGDPVAVWDAYAAELGIDDVAGAAQACTVGAIPDEPDDASNHQRFLTEPALDDEVRLACSARIGTTEASLASGVVGCVRPNVSDDPCELRSGSVLHLRKDVDDGGEQLRGDALGTDSLRREREVPDGPIIPPDLQGSGPSNLPQAGERIDDGIDHHLGTDGAVSKEAVLPDGAESLVSPAMLIDCGSGLVAVVSLPHPPADAVAAFGGGHSEGSSPVRSGVLGDRAWATRSFDSVGGSELLLTAVSGAEEGSSYVLATECGD